MQLLDNTQKPLADILSAQLARAHEALIHVAYLRRSGIAALEADLRQFLERGRALRLLCGADFGLTERQAEHLFQTLLHRAFRGEI